MKLQSIKIYFFPFLLLLSILLGGLTGSVLGERAIILKPIGDIFLNLIFTVVIPLVFFSIASSIVNMDDVKKFSKIIYGMMGTFLFTSIIAAVFMISVVKMFPPGNGVLLDRVMPAKVASTNIAEQIVNIFTVSDFLKLFSRENMLALMFFSVLVGLATLMTGERGRSFRTFLESGMEIFMKIISFIMYYAPIGFFAYFAVLVGEIGPQLLGNYFRATLIYYPSALIYFVVAFTFYAYIADRIQGVQIFWKNIFPSIITSLATCSSAASIPVNLEVTKKIGVSSTIYQMIIPFGAFLHKDGSVLGGIIKISFLFSIFKMSFSSPTVLLTALIVAVLVGTVMGAIPSGGMVGEMLILSVYGFPPEALVIIAAISIIIDPLATMLNVTGDVVCTMMTARLLNNQSSVE